MTERLHALRGLLAGLALLAQAPLAMAATGDATMTFVDRRQAHQQARIARGAASGALTPHEQQRLQRGQAAIARSETLALADGRVTPHERHRLQHYQDHASRSIRRQAHDRQHMPVVTPLG